MENKNISKNQQIAAGQFGKEKEYWLSKLDVESEKGYFPYDNYKESTTGDNPKEMVTFKTSGELYARLMQITNGSYPKIHMVLTAGVAALLGKYNRYPNVLLGTSIEKQDTEEPLVNTVLPLVIPLPDDITFKKLIMEIRRTVNEAIENQNFPVETLARDQEALFDVAVLLLNIQDKKYVDHLQTNMVFSFLVGDNQVEGELEYDTSRYEKESVERILWYFQRLMEIALFNVDLEIKDIELLSPGDNEVLARFNVTGTEYPHQKTIYELFALQAEKTPDNTALIKEDGESSMTYRQLNRGIRRWAEFLLSRKVAPGAVIGIQLTPSIEQVCAVMAVLKSGCVYLPIDINYPIERKRYLLEDSGTRWLITRKELTEDLKWDGGILYTEEMPGVGDDAGPRTHGDVPVSSTDPAYVIYTSGSTGKPKGVVVDHRALVNYIWWAAKMYVKGEKTDFPLYTSIAFDLTVTSIFTPLITGNGIFIYTGEDKEFLVEKVFDKNNVDVVKLTPVHLMLIGNRAKESTGEKESGDPKIKRFIVGGEKLETQLARKINEHFDGNIEIYNEYGPTEATVGCMIYKFNPRKDKGASVPIGVPADNVQIYLLDRHGNNVVTGGVGELYIAGHGLAGGYLNRPELTAEKFIPNPFEPGKKMYKTGDMALRQPDGNISFLGRVDQQVKIRGYRIETGEVENYLSKHRDIDQSVVVAKDDGSGYRYLAAYFIPAGESEKNSTDPGELRAYLADCVPEFMIPSYFVKLDKIPLTANGKIDKGSLPDPHKNALDSGTRYHPPTNELEKIMVEIWQSVMGVKKVGIDDSYFDLGGDSIKAIQLSARMKQFNWKLELKDLFQYITIRELANYIKPLKKIASQEIVEGEVKLTPIQKWFFERNFPEEHHFNQSVMLHRPEEFREEIIRSVFFKLMKHHDALRIIYKRENGKIKQVNKGAADNRELVDLEIVDIPGENDLENVIREKCNRVQSSIDLAGGPLVKLGLFKTVRGDYLLIVVHHLVFDGLSWRILFEDFASLYPQIESGVPEENWEIPLKTTSYKEWAEKLYHYSNSNELLEELEYWKNIEAAGPLPLFKNKRSKKGKGKEGRQLFFELSEEYTEKLLKQANIAYNTEINDILLTALGLAFNDWCGTGKIPVILEGHGREEIIPDVDITRTVGWFTSVYPVLLDMTKRDDLSSVIKNIKEMLRNIPCKGIGYGILKYLTKEENKKGLEYRLNPEISFNYLGQFDEDINTELFRIPNISSGNAVSMNLDRIYPFYISGMIFEKKLRMSLNYDMNQYDEEEIRSLVDRYENRLMQIIDHCISREKAEFTLSDFSTPIDEVEAEKVFDALSGVTLEE